MRFRPKGAGRPLWRTLFGALLAACLLLLFVYALEQGAFRSILQDNTVPVPTEGQAGFALHMMDVGQAQALLLTCGGKAALVDTGLRDTADEVADYLYRQGVRKLDYVFVTHPHSDHCGGAKDILAEVGAETLVIPEYLSEEAALATAGDWVGETGIGIAITHAGETFSLGEAVITVLHPAAGNAIEDMNDLSLVLRVEYGGKNLLLTGDITSAVEESLLPLGHVDLLQVPHHGSGTSSSEAFLADITPDFALISCGRNNDYGHPHQNVVERLEAAGAEIFRTDEQGIIVARIREGKLTVTIENEK